MIYFCLFNKKINKFKQYFGTAWTKWKMTDQSIYIRCFVNHQYRHGPYKYVELCFSPGWVDRTYMSCRGAGTALNRRVALPGSHLTIKQSSEVYLCLASPFFMYISESEMDCGADFGLFSPICTRPTSIISVIYVSRPVCTPSFLCRGVTYGDDRCQMKDKSWKLPSSTWNFVFSHHIRTITLVVLHLTAPVPTRWSAKSHIRESLSPELVCIP